MNDAQLELRPRDPRRVDVDGVVDGRHSGIRFIGEAVEQLDGTFRALADVEGSLCLVEVKISPKEGA